MLQLIPAPCTTKHVIMSCEVLLVLLLAVPYNGHSLIVALPFHLCEACKWLSPRNGGAVGAAQRLHQRP